MIARLCMGLLLTWCLSTSCNNSVQGINAGKDSLAAAHQNTQDTSGIKEETVTYNDGSTLLKSYIVYKEGQEKRPAVLVIPEWWGLNDYPKSRARQLAELGYVAMAVDTYGDGKVADNPNDAQKLATPFYKNPFLTKSRINAALTKLKTYPQVDTNNIAAIGYCYGGFVVLNAAKLGADLKGVVSFHGNLSGVAPDKNLLKAKILVCQGGADKFVGPQEQATFKKQMDSVGADYTFKVYPNATHAFTNPASTENGKKFNMPIAYNAEADKNSWNDMKNFFDSLFKK